MWIDIGSHGFDLGSVNPAYKAVRPKLNDQQKKNNSEFLNAIVGDDAQKVQAMLSNPDDFKFLRQAVTENGTPALVLAATKDNLEIVNALMYANFDLRVVNTHGNSALHWAARKGNLEIIRLLTSSFLPINERGNLVNRRNHFGESALHWAAEAGHNDVVQFLCAQNANINLANSRGLIPKEVASKELTQETLDLLKQNVVHHTAHEIKSLVSNFKLR